LKVDGETGDAAPPRLYGMGAGCLGRGNPPLNARAGDADPGSLKEEKKSYCALLELKITQSP
jgi:hypothetical protein